MQGHNSTLMQERPESGAEQHGANRFRIGIRQ
jgi:hypothetical protein